MTPHNKTAATTGIVEAAVVKNVVVTSSYTSRPEIATVEYAAAKLATRFRLSISTSREVCRMAGIGGSR